jgi:hypothetical protein
MDVEGGSVGVTNSLRVASNATPTSLFGLAVLSGAQGSVGQLQRQGPFII